MPIKAVILVGGPSRGTRFRPLSLNSPKPLFPIGGKPMLYHHCAALAKVQGLTEVILIGFYEPNSFQSFIESTQEELKITIRYFREFQSLGTAGGLYHFRDQILRGNPEAVFVLHSDVASAFPLTELLKFHQEKNAVATIMGTRVPRDVSHRFGCVVENAETKEVLHYVEKPETFVSDLISCGIYLFTAEIFSKMQSAFRKSTEDLFEDTEQSSSERLRLEQDILRPLAGSKSLYVFETKAAWRQIKTASSALPANAMYLSMYQTSEPSRLATDKPGGPKIIGNVSIHPTATVHPSCKLGPNVSIGARVVIGEGVRIKESIILENAEIKSNACILSSIVGWSSTIGKWARVEGTLPTAKNAYDEETGQPTVTILGEDVQVFQEIIVRNCIVLAHKELKSSVSGEVIM